MKRIAVIASVLALLAASCGGDTSGSTAGPGTAAGSLDAGQSGTTTAPPGNGGSFGLITSGSTEELCSRLFTLEEVAALFDEPAALDETGNGYNPSLGQIVCSWGTIEDPADSSDLAFESLVVQVYTGDPIPGGTFFDPDAVYEGARHLDGIGDDAFVAGSLGLATGFVDGQIAGFVAYTAFDMSGGEPAGAGEERVIDYLRMLHDRAT